jgi:hypothetical protein
MGHVRRLGGPEIVWWVGRFHDGTVVGRCVDGASSRHGRGRLVGHVGVVEGRRVHDGGR